MNCYFQIILYYLFSSFEIYINVSKRKLYIVNYLNENFILFFLKIYQMILIVLFIYLITSEIYLKNHI